MKPTVEVPNIRIQIALLSTVVIILSCDCVDSRTSLLFKYKDNTVGNFTRPTELDLMEEVPFFGRKYNKVYISADGVLGFDAGIGYQEVLYEQGVHNTVEDFPFIAAFHYNGLKPFNVSSYRGQVYYKLIRDRRTLNDFKGYVWNATVGHSEYVHPLMALQVTWENVQEEGCVTDTCPTATFQIVFVAFKDHSLVFVNYDMMAIPQKLYYQAGFNGGDGLGWKSILPCGQSSCKLTLNDLPRLQGSDVKGRFIFDVGDQEIRRGGCIPPEADGVLKFSPRFASLLGGQMLTVSGTCNPNLQSVMCKFGTDPHAVITEGIVVNSMLARCPVPRLTQRGDTEISFSVGGQAFRHKSTIAIVQIGRFPCTLTLGGGWKEKDTDRLSVTWNPDRISSNRNTPLDIVLIGYREIGSVVEWKEIKILKRNHLNTGSFSFWANHYRCQDDECNFEIGVVEVRLRQTDWEQANTDIAVNCGMVPLAWFIRKYSESWPEEKCKEWQTEDQKDLSWLDDLLPCPDTLNDSLSDFGRWQPDDACYLNSKSGSNSVIYEDNRVETFDDLEYVFKERGDFWLYKSNTMKLQGRFHIQQNTSTLTGVAMTEEEDVVEVRLSPSNLISGNRLQVLVNNVTKWFDVEPLRMQDFSDVSVITNEATDDLDRHGNFTVIFSSGVGVIIAEQKRRLHVKISLPPQHKNMKTDTGGLFGTWNDDPTDDLTMQYSNHTVTEDLSRFALSWAVHDNERLFKLAYPFVKPVISQSSRVAHANGVVLTLCVMLTMCVTFYSTAEEVGNTVIDVGVCD